MMVTASTSVGQCPSEMARSPKPAKHCGGSTLFGLGALASAGLSSDANCGISRGE
jgi:hypothetical protein